MKTLLYVGLEPPKRSDVKIIHCPLIEIVPRTSNCPDIIQARAQLSTITYIIVTSKTAARCLFQLIGRPEELQDKLFLSVGKQTTKCLNSFGIDRVITAREESQEGMIALIQDEQLTSQTFFWGHSSLSRPHLGDFLKGQVFECILYDTLYKKPGPGFSLDEVDEIFFSSPSTVRAFCAHFGELPKDKILHAQGKQTSLALQTMATTVS